MQRDRFEQGKAVRGKGKKPPKASRSATKLKDGYGEPTTYLEIQFAEIMGVSKTVAAKGGKCKTKTQTHVSWEDPDAVFMLKWFVPSMAWNRRTRSYDSFKRVDGRLAFQMPISCSEGFNWIVYGKNAMVLAIAPMSWDASVRCYLLPKRAEELAVDNALNVTTDRNSVKQFTYVGSDPGMYAPTGSVDGVVHRLSARYCLQREA